VCVQKIDGCNKMRCMKCSAQFCWLCLSVITENNPYSHFNSTKSPCFNKLFLGIDVNRDVDVDVDGDDDDEFVIMALMD